MTTIEPETIVLDVFQHPDVVSAMQKKRHIESDIRRLEEEAARNQKAAAEAEIDLAKLELDVEYGDASPSSADAARKALDIAESKVTDARKDAQRRKTLLHEFDEKIKEAIRSATAEISVNAADLIGEMSAQYLDLMKRTFELGQQIDEIYSELSQSRRAAYHRFQVHGPQLPHESPVLRFRTDASHGEYVRAIERHFRTFRENGYEI